MKKSLNVFMICLFLVAVSLLIELFVTFNEAPKFVSQSKHPLERYFQSLPKENLSSWRLNWRGQDFAQSQLQTELKRFLKPIPTKSEKWEIEVFPFDPKDFDQRFRSKQLNETERLIFQVSILKEDGTKLDEKLFDAEVPIGWITKKSYRSR